MTIEDVPPSLVWERLRDDPGAMLVDVRTDAEWNFVGLPDLSELGRQPALIPWQLYPSMQINAGFADMLRRAGARPETPLYFICRSGARSLAAAQTAQAAGYGKPFNVADGFEGPPDASGHRGTVAGWKAEGLPWRQR
ncbi:rhodanese-like domain-containing protein [Roseomonas gilardii subsp. gilardii]|uniref:rhodanese-like domain-containing protein n=1 Tax=Roseomonas gilardii TaxID=257708 RepID=UPI001FF9A1A1|nr:rhodanese-like domain-containing protein [Roseomonas gilardii]UPG70923.1 rhodanese-like domain-containing protein [Roseomonas gilardii subsp. gilardii]